MRVSIGNDHHGVKLKAKLIPWLKSLGHEVMDEGAGETGAVDYPDYAAAVGKRVSNGEADRGLLICGSGVGMAITANKFSGVRAAVCSDDKAARLCRQHNDVNVLCMPGEQAAGVDPQALVKTWLDTEFEGGRHANRVEKIREIERQAKSCP